MKFKAQWSQTPDVVQICEATIEAEDSEEALQKFLEGAFDRFLVTSEQKMGETDVDFASVTWLKK